MTKKKMASENVEVAVVVRAFSETELSANGTCVVDIDGDEVRVTNPESKQEKCFTFDHTFWSAAEGKKDSASRKQVVEELGDHILSSTFDGYNACLFSYGASASGKSCIMYGTETRKGVIPWVCENLFAMAGSFEDPETSFRAEISFLEIHREFVKDLLGRRRNWQNSLRVREHSELGVYVDKLTKHIITDSNEVSNLIEKGKKNRTVCSRASNSASCNSHTIFTLRFTQARLQNGMPLEMVSVLHLVDLAGSKSIHDECNNVNSSADHPDDKSLMMLERVISTLASKASVPDSKATVPYKDSALTWILKDCLGGNCRTVMLAAVSPSDVCYHETLNTLRFANQAKVIMNTPLINENSNVKLIKELKTEIHDLRLKVKTGNVSGGMGMEKTEKKLQENEELMKRLTGIWEEKWSKTQKIIEERSLAVTELGSALKFETDEPHFVSLGGGRLSIGVTLCPIKRGKTVIGVATETSKPDIELRGRGIESEHCVVEYNGDAVVLQPKGPLCSVDGIPITEPTKLPQGCMVCLGKSNYFRFNHPKEAQKIREANPGNRFSIVPDGYYPDVELAIEQYKKDKQERERLRLENARLLSLEQEYKQAVERIEFEKKQLEEERQQLHAMEREHKEAVGNFEHEIAVQITELESQRVELENFEKEKEKLLLLQEQYEEKMKNQEDERKKKELYRQEAYERLRTMQTQLQSEGGNAKKHVELEEERQRLALLQLECLEEEMTTWEKQQQDRDLIEEEKGKIDEMKERQSEVIRQLEDELSAQIKILKEDRERENARIEAEKERIRVLEKQQEQVLKQIEEERARLEKEKDEEKKRLEEERKRLNELAQERIETMEKAAKEQEKEKKIIQEEKKRLLELEEKHAQAMQDLEETMITKQEKIEREREIEFEFFETEQLLLEELEHKQREAATQLQSEREAMLQQLQKEREEERRKMELEQERFQEQQQQQQEKLRQAEEERRKLQVELKTQREQMQRERTRLVGLEQEYKKIRGGPKTEGGINLSIITGRDVTQVAKGCSLQERKQRLEEEKRRLMELKKEADNLWFKVKKQQEGCESGESDSDKEEKGVAEGKPEGGEGSRPHAKSAKSVPSEVDDYKFKELERALAMERKRRQDMEKLLSEKQKQEELDRIAALEKAKKDMMTEKAIQERLSAKVSNGTSKGDDLNLVQHLVSVGHVLENCPSVRVTSTACKGYLAKMSGRLIKSWKKRWFVLDRQKRALCYYSDERKREPKGIIYFQAIQEVYTDLSAMSKGSGPRSTFCVKTPQVTYHMSAPSGLAMSIWIDAILTGREGADFYN